MGDFTTSACTDSLTCQLIRFNPYAVTQIKGHHYFMATQKSYIALPLSFTRNFECKHARTHMLARRAFSGLQAEYESAEKAENPMQNETGGEGEANDKTQNASSAEEFLFMMAAHSDRDYAASSGTETIANFASDTSQTENTADAEIVHAHTDYNTHTSSAACEERVMNRKAQQLTYLFAALASSVGITSLAGASVYYRFSWQMEGGEVPWTEMLGTFSLALGAAVGMEYWARWAHRALWHASLWSMHESHHRPRDGPFELNDVFAIINAIPAIGLIAFGFLHKGLVPGLCFGAGLGITIFGIAYMFVHDGLVHRRFPVGPIADVPYFQKVAAAHQLHHADKFNGVPYGLFLGPTELEEVGGRAELEKVLQKRKRENTNPING